ncbi:MULTISPECIES: SNF2-related protein [unclassified Paenibacillus]|uniref:SNF2-related protein n=1 Tax=Paenibacillus provencensis TaxID=441151 RepID=A0ABW3PWY9_9BACL|nr:MULTISPECIES: SNF2-related protein [unclassified Paenibacillus]MCM3130162.1 SNF2-related protein [Paenibacillus sp. MER 78]SDX70843.1 Helicase conserved C-terminal domain-containing protein [Paenibacillus sp. PDC88]SFS88326.1 Helicase conserved C-terminal domain-containing protein [Paenibacillus sp. 453mf]
MKYQHSGIIIPYEKRKEINEKIIHIIETKQDFGISSSDIYQAYTGDGGLHGLSRSDYGSYHAYAEAKKEIEQGQFFSPPSLCEFLVGVIKPSMHDLIADLTCGMGTFFNFVPMEANVYGNELDMKAFKVAKQLYPEAQIQCSDIRIYEPGIKFDIIFGNPPFNLRWEYRTERYLSQLFYCIRAHDLLNPAGFLALIVPSSFLSDDFSDASMIEEMNKRYSFVCQIELPRDAFKMYGVNEFETKIMIFQKRSEHLEAIQYSLAKTPAPSFDAKGADYVHNQYILPLKKSKEKVRHKILFEGKNANSEDLDFTFKVKKMLFDIKRHPALVQYYAKCVDYVNRYHSEEKPKEMTVQEWEKKRITKGKVLAYLRRVLKNQNVVHRDEIRLVKRNYGLKLKAYSPKMQAKLNKMREERAASFNSMVHDDIYPFEDKMFSKLWKRKKEAYEVQSQALVGMRRSQEVDRFLDAFSLYDSSRDEVIKLNPMQKHDLGLVMQKRYSILNWSMGSGKTIGAIAWYKRLLEQKAVRNVFVVSAALAIHLTWEVKLANFGERFVVIRSLKDIESIRSGQIVLISLNRLQKYKRQIQKFVRIRSQKVALVMDEADELTNPKSLRTKAVLSCFRRVRHKLLTTGTVTRNNINEIYPLLELLYNNSINMMCDCNFKYEVNKEGVIEELANTDYNRPYPAYGGLSLFKQCFSPAKVTVFGVKKHNQDILNSESLSRLIKKTIITRKFDEIVGEKIYSHIPHRIEQNAAEVSIYGKIINEFQKMMHYFVKTGNSKKESMLKIIRQIQLLIKSTSCPHLMDEYDSLLLPSKFYYIMSLVEKFDEKVAIGTVFLETAAEYYRLIQERFPNRPVFLIKGDVSFERRTQLIEEYETSQNGILISTQQSLKSSVNIPSCNKVIVESLQWNIPKLEQFGRQMMSA